MNHRFSGHETFPFRYAWIPKVTRAVAVRPDLFTNEEEAMVELGLGRNMVKSARFWAEACGMISSSGGTLAVTDLGKTILGNEGYDPFLEDIRTLWLLHWIISTDASLGAWDYLLGRCHEPRFSKSLVVSALERMAEENSRQLSNVTFEQHFDVFLHTYLPTRSRKGDVHEDNLDSPLVELGLLKMDRPATSSTSATGLTAEPTFVFSHDPRPEIGGALFAWCLEMFWKTAAAREHTLPIDLICFAPHSPGQVFKLREEDIRLRLEGISDASGGRFIYVDSASVAAVQRITSVSPIPLHTIYQADLEYA